MATLQQLIDYSRQNPDSDIAVKTRRAIEGGAYDAEAAASGIDLSWAGRPKVTAPTSTQPTAQPFNTQIHRMARGDTSGAVEHAKGAAKGMVQDIIAPAAAHNAGPVGEAMMNDAREKGNEFAAALDTSKTSLEPSNPDQREGRREAIITSLAIPGPRGVKATVKTAQMASAPFKTSFDARTAAEFAQEGITAPISAISNSPFLKALEAMTAKGIFGKPVMETVENARAAIDAKIARTAEAATPKKAMSDELLGKTMAEDLRNSVTAFKDKQDRVYSAFAKNYGDIYEAPENTLAALQSIVADQSQDFFKGVDPRLAKMFERLNGDTKIVKDARKQGLPPEMIDSLRAEHRPTMSISEMRSTRTAIGEAIAKDPDNGALKHLYGAISQDLKASLGVHDQAGAQLMQKLDADYASGISKLEGRIAQSIEQANPENIVYRLFERDSADAINVLKNLVKPETFDEYRVFFLNNLFSKSVVRDKFSVEKLRKNLEAYDQPTLDAVLDPESKAMLEQLTTRLDKLENLSDKLKPTEKLLGGSQTAFLQQAALPVTAGGALAGALTTGNLPLAAMIAGGFIAKYGTTKLFTTRFGRKFLTQGYGQK